jgi:putative pyruvate formate lyase activating enzyme
MDEEGIKREIIKNYGDCKLCPWECRINRFKEKGVCKLGVQSNIFYEGVIYGEELSIVPTYAIFFAGCNMKCIFCEYGEYQENPGNVCAKSLSNVLKRIKEMGNGYASISFIGGEPSIHPLNIYKIISKCQSKNIKKVLNTNLYFNKINRELLDEMIDIYIGDIHFGNDDCAEKLSGAINYTELVLNNVKAIYHSKKKLIIRHLLLPGHIDCCFKPIVNYLVENGIVDNFNLLTNYLPWHKARSYGNMGRMITEVEKDVAKEILYRNGIKLVLDEYSEAREIGSNIEEDEHEIIIDSEGRIIIPYLTGEMVMLAGELVPDDPNIVRIKKILERKQNDDKTNRA